MSHIIFIIVNRQKSKRILNAQKKCNWLPRLLASSATLLSKYDLLRTASKYTTKLEAATSKLVSKVYKSFINVENKRRHCDHTQETDKVTLHFTILSQHMLQQLQKPCNLKTTPAKWPQKEPHTIHVYRLGQSLLYDFNTILWMYRKLHQLENTNIIFGAVHNYLGVQFQHAWLPYNVPVVSLFMYFRQHILNHRLMPLWCGATAHRGYA